MVTKEEIASRAFNNSFENDKRSYQVSAEEMCHFDKNRTLLAKKSITIFFCLKLKMV